MQSNNYASSGNTNSTFERDEENLTATVGEEGSQPLTAEESFLDDMKEEDSKSMHIVNEEPEHSDNDQVVEEEEKALDFSKNEEK